MGLRHDRLAGTVSGSVVGTCTDTFHKGHSPRRRGVRAGGPVARTAWSRSSPSRRTSSSTSMISRRSVRGWRVRAGCHQHVRRGERGSSSSTSAGGVQADSAGQFAVRWQPAEGHRGPGVLPPDQGCSSPAQPTRGVDVGSIEYIHGRIVPTERGVGTAVLRFVSSELDEVIALGRPDRRHVRGQGRGRAGSRDRSAPPTSASTWQERSRERSTRGAGDSRAGRPFGEEAGRGGPRPPVPGDHRGRAGLAQRAARSPAGRSSPRCSSAR